MSFSATPAVRRRFRPQLEVLEDRAVPAINVLPDAVNGVITFRGDSKAQNIIILDVPDFTTSINIDSDGDGALDMFLDSALQFGGAEFELFVFDLRGGNDRIEYRQLRDLDGRTRRFEVNDYFGSNSFSYDANGFGLINGTEVSLEWNSGKKNDVVTVNFDAITDSNFTISTDFGNGANGLNMIMRGALTNAAVNINQNGGTGVDSFNLFIQRQALLDNSTLAVVANLDAGHDAFSVSINSEIIGNGSRMSFDVNCGSGNDVLNYRLNGAVGDASVELDGDLSSGHDSFTTTLGFDFYFDDSSAQVLYRVNGGSGNETMFIFPFTLLGLNASLFGQLDYQIDTGTGNDTVTYATLDIVGQTGAELEPQATGRFLLNLNMGAGNDILNLTLHFGPNSNSADVEISVLMGSGNDRVNFSGSDPVGMNYLPSGGVRLDGGSGANLFNLLFNNPLGLVPLDTVNF